MNELSTARINKDKNYDGRFFFGVKTTGIFCRPSCPAPVAKEENVIYFGSVFEALDKSFVPCYRCRPDIELDYCPGNPEGNLITSLALELIYDSFLNTHTIFDLAKKLDVSERHLRKLFIDNIESARTKWHFITKQCLQKR
jgi:AraC family transcriptional regulator, regulatory protein of adaptative response / DNA-3-methyladenine glycosylase II